MSFLTSLWLQCWVRPRVLPAQITERLTVGERPLCLMLPTDAAFDRQLLIQLLQQPPWQQVFSQRQVIMPDGYPINLQRWVGLLGTRLDSRTPDGLRQLVAAEFNSITTGDAQHEVDLLPISLFWGRAPDRSASGWRLLLSGTWAESWATSSKLHRFLATVINGRSLLIQVGEPVSLRSMMGDATNPAVATRRVARTCRNLFYRQRAAIIGPEIASHSTIAAQVLRASSVRQAMHAEMRSKNLTRKQALQAAQKYVGEIASDYSHVTVSLLARLFRRVWNRLYDGVELHHLEQLQAVIDTNEVIYVPCHRSHLDYLLLSYVIYSSGYAVPHVAAGVNLNLPVLGSVLRKGGAFFIRRSFTGNALYSAVFTKYLGLMMERGHPLEYFIEGGRSRTGRLLPPKTGALTITVRSYLRNPRRPVVFVPVYFGYERVVEGNTYLSELSGQPKQKETVLGMLKVLPTLRQSFGKVHVSIGEPIHLDAMLDRYASEWRDEAVQDKPTWLSPLVDDLSLRIMRNINDAAYVTPINLLALVLLATPKHALLEADLVRQLNLYAALLRSTPYSALIGVTDMSAVEVIAYAERMRLLQRNSHEMGDVLSMTEANAIQVTYFRNNTLHLMVLPSAIASCFQNNRQVRTEDIQRLAWRIYPYLCDELFLRWDEVALPDVVNALIKDMAEHGLLISHDDGASWFRPAVDTAAAVQLSLLGQLSMQIIERYYLAVALLLKAGSGRVSQAALERQCFLMAQRISLLYELNSPEFFDQGLFKNFFDLLRKRSVLGINAEGRLTYTDMLVAVADDAELVLHEQIRNSILQVTHR
ncbi:MAG: glycerol-3-phosphate 1-O-acyltransferase PlsB [Steroidobacteraceae bacterium]